MALNDTQLDLLRWNWMLPNARRESGAHELVDRLEEQGLIALDSSRYGYCRTLTEDGRDALAEAKRVNGGPVPPRTGL